MTSNRFVILVDIDSVLGDFETAFLETFRRIFPDKDPIPLSERRTWRPCDQYPPHLVAQVTRSDFYSHIQLFPGAKKALETMKKLPDTEVYICTSPIKTNYAGSCTDKLVWVERNLGEEWLPRVIITNDKTQIYGNILFDDKHEFNGVVQVPKWEQILFTDCHNKHVDEKGRVRLDGWEPQNVWLDLVQDRLNRWRQRRDYE